eukprot:scaffold25994_cov30-Tisochrysis_lutea.AAC.1
MTCERACCMCPARLGCHTLSHACMRFVSIVMHVKDTTHTQRASADIRKFALQPSLRRSSRAQVGADYRCRNCFLK